ncbi:hypothetical protein AK812_SmicGene40903 [Symbiodinium microadriaticum]|uniref:Uncharacterized protein n=1 Tax=Symbiodinium microadriaticum TaxID=2951 RepID=A0A1Q9C7I0_SYMMI|nr:hypothetical protein AK812_SmicGene40903 [Symbiodinium microadriaticum]
MDFCADAFRVFAVASAMSVRLPAEALCRWQVVQSAVLGLYGLLRVNANEQTVVLATAADVFATLLNPAFDARISDGIIDLEERIFRSCLAATLEPGKALSFAQKAALVWPLHVQESFLVLKEKIQDSLETLQAFRAEVAGDVLLSSFLNDLSCVFDDCLTMILGRRGPGFKGGTARTDEDPVQVAALRLGSCGSCRRSFDILTYSCLPRLKLPLPLVLKAMHLHFENSTSSSLKDMGRRLGLSGGNKGSLRKLAQHLRAAEAHASSSVWLKVLFPKRVTGPVCLQARSAQRMQQKRKRSGWVEADARCLIWHQFFGFVERPVGAAVPRVHLYELPLISTLPNAKSPQESKSRILETRAFDCLRRTTSSGRSTVLLTDGAKAYPGLARACGIKHLACNHAEGGVDTVWQQIKSEYDDVVNEAKKNGQKVHMARVHGLIYEKNYQLKEDDPARKFKGGPMLMVVYQGRTCRWQILFKLTSKQDYPALHAGLSFQMKRGIHRRTVINSDDLYVAWSKHLMDILMQELCGSNIVTQQYKRAPVCNGKSHRCTWCGNTMPVDADGRLIPPPPIPKCPVEEEVTEGYVPLAYEVIAKMAADIRTKPFKDIMDLMKPTHSQSTAGKGQQVYTFKSEESAEIPDSPVKFDRYVERAVFQCQPVRPTLPSALTIEDFVQTAVTHPYGRRFMRALSGEWRACTRVSHYLFDATVVLIDKELLTLDLWEVAVWSLIGVDDDNWWSELVPGRQIDDPMCDYLADVIVEVPPEAQAGDGRLVSMLVKGPKKKPDGVIVEFGHSESVKGKGPASSGLNLRTTKDYVSAKR